MYKSLHVQGPFKGIVDHVPDPNSDPAAFRDVLNWFCRKGRVQTRPRLNAFPAPPDNNVVRNIITYSDVLNYYHTLVLTTQNAYHLSEHGTYTALTYPGGVTTLGGTGFPYAYALINDRLYFSNGSRAVLYVDGETSMKVAGDVQGAARFMAVNANHLLVGYTTEPALGVSGSKIYRRRVRWSKSGDADDWTSFSAGWTDLLEVPDEITGMAALGRNTFIFRSNGISVAVPTGVGLAPFAIEQFSYSPIGVGNQYAYSLATYNNRAIFVGNDDIYCLDASNLQAIGGATKKKIFADLENNDGDVVSGHIVARFGRGFDFLSYWLTIPGVDVTWVFHWDEGTWQRFQSSLGELTCISNVATR